MAENLYVHGVIRNKCAEQKNFHTNHFKNSIILGLFLDLVPADSEELFPAVHPLPNGSGRLIFGDGLDNPIPARLDVLLGQRGASQWYVFTF
jgi:hypothetical protein